MLLGRVVGTLWSTRRSARVGAFKLAIVEPHASYELPGRIDHVVCIDTIGACAGEDVVVCFGQPSRAAAGDQRTPIDAAVMAIVDRCEFGPGARPATWRDGGQA